MENSGRINTLLIGGADDVMYMHRSKHIENVLK